MEDLVRHINLREMMYFLMLLMDTTLAFLHMVKQVLGRVIRLSDMERTLGLSL